MKLGFYPKFAFMGIRRNKRLYTPYVLTCVGMVMMFYIVTALAGMETLGSIRGGGSAAMMLDFGSWVIGVFSLIFLFYTNSFLIRRRKREFGLYNILGMGKGNIARILLWETGIVLVFSLAVGLALGVLLCKLFELSLVNMLRGTVDYALHLNVAVLRRTLTVYGTIFLGILLNSLLKIRNDSPVALLRSENVGEKPPKANWFFAIVGVALLAMAYYMAVTITNPMDAMVWFFVAVVMVIVATYLIFIAGSVTLCRFLQRCRGYYYKANHFVSVSSMAYRMKRNGAGLASICILATMVLVTISSTTCLYFGQEGMLSSRYPKDITVKLTVYEDTDERAMWIDRNREAVRSVLAREGVEAKDIQEYSTIAATGLIRDGALILDHNIVERYDYSQVVSVRFLPLEDYNRMMGKQASLEPGQALVYCYRCDYTGSAITIAGRAYEIRERLEGFIGSGDATMDLVGSIFLVVPDFPEAERALRDAVEAETGMLLGVQWIYGFDMPIPAEEQIALDQKLEDAVYGLVELDEFKFARSAHVECREWERADFYGTFGGLLFLGLMLSVVFGAAAVLIIYYKQLCEGYEDQSRFDIMQKVGMTARDIRRSINSQMLTVFFLPLITAGLHLAFAFPLVSKLLALFNLFNQELLIAITAGSFLLFSLLYFVVYKITSNAYYTIVSGGREK